MFPRVVLLLIAWAWPLSAQERTGLGDPRTWAVREVGLGVTLWQRSFEDLFGVPQYLAVLWIDRRAENPRLGVASAGGRQWTSAMARAAGAVAAVNGGFFAPDGTPRGLLKADGTLLSPATEGQACLGLDGDGQLSLAVRAAGDWSESVDALGAGPMLLTGGSVIDHGDRQRAIRHPRTALGVDPEGRILLLTVDGRNERAGGMSFEETAQVFLELGCVEAINLDGGGSTTLWVAGLGIVNHPSDNKQFDAAGEREVANAILVFAPSVLALDDSTASRHPPRGWEEQLAARGAWGDRFTYAADGGDRSMEWVLFAPKAGRYRLQARWPRLLERASGWSRLRVGFREWDLEQRPVGGRWVDLGQLTLEDADSIRFLWEGVPGVPFLADALRLEEIAR